MNPNNDSLKSIRAVSVDVAAEALSMSKRALYRLMQAGEFPLPIKIGAASRVLVEDLERFIERQRQRRGC